MDAGASGFKASDYRNDRRGVCHLRPPRQRGSHALTPRLPLRPAIVSGVAMFAAFIGDAQGNLHAQGKLDARYEVSLGGIPLGKGAWTIDVGHDRFTAAASGGTDRKSTRLNSSHVSESRM